MLKFLILICFLCFPLTFATDTCPFPCNGHPLTAYYAKNPRGCAWFFTCNIGLAPKEGRCPENYLFNHQKQICDFPEKVDCSESEPMTECPPFGIVKIQHPDTCSKFILCFDGKEEDRNCPLGHHFSTFENDCVIAQKSDCRTDQVFCEEKRDEGNKIFPKIANPRNCSTFYVCSGDGWVITNECFGNWHFNPDTGNCEDSPNVCDVDGQQQSLGLPEQIDFDCSDKFDGSPHPHPDRDFWFLCMGGRTFLHKCGTGTEFNADEGRCTPQ